MVVGAGVGLGVFRSTNIVCMYVCYVLMYEFLANFFIHILQNEEKCLNFLILFVFFVKFCFVFFFVHKNTFPQLI